MSEKKGILGALFGGKSGGGCCNMEIVEEPKKKRSGCCDMQIVEETEQADCCPETQSRQKDK